MQLTLNLNQRWLGGRASYRPPSEPIRASEYDVAEILVDDNTARDFILLTHRSSGSAVHRWSSEFGQFQLRSTGALRFYVQTARRLRRNLRF